MKNHIRGSIKNIDKLHVKIAGALLNAGGDEYLNESALQFETAGRFDESFGVYERIIAGAYSANAFRYITSILQKLLSFPADCARLAGVKLELSRVLLRSGDFLKALELTEELLIENNFPGEYEKLLLQKSELLLKTGDYAKAVSILSGISTGPGKLAADLLLADAYLYLEEYDKAVTHANATACNSDSTDQLKGKANNLLALYHLYARGDLDACIECFSKAAGFFQKANDNIMLGGMMINIGNIHVMKNDYGSAMRIWNETSDLVKSYGNFEQEAKLLMNYGILLSDIHEYEKALDSYRKAKSIFEHYGDVAGLGMSCINLGEINFILCDYTNALLNLKEAHEIFSALGSSEDLAEIFFISAKIYFTLWNKDLLLYTAEEMHSVTSGTGHPAGSKKLFVDALVFLMQEKYDQSYDLAENIKSAVAVSGERENKNLYAECIFLQADLLLLQAKYETVSALMEDEKLSALCTADELFRAKKEYRVAECKLSLGNRDAFGHITECFSLIENFSITEISWKVLSLFVRFYEERGNAKQAEKYLHYLKNIFLKIFSGLTNPLLQESFAKKPEIQKILNLL